MALTSKLPEIIAAIDAAVKDAEAASAELVAESARARVPVDKGDLKEAIHVEANTDGDGFWIIAGGKTAGDRDVFYGHMVEHGTTHSPPEPFLVPALEENRAKITDGIAAAIQKATP